MIAIRNHEATRTVYLHIPGDNPDSPLVYIIPGNPGICEYYWHYAEELAKLLPDHEIAAPSHRGYNLDSPEGQLRTESTLLDDQIAHKIEFLESLVSTKRDVLIFGHSVGAWISQRIAVHFADHPTVRIKFVGLLTPTLQDISLSERGASFSNMSRYLTPLIAARVTQVLSWILPRRVTEYLVRRVFKRDMSPHIIDTSTKLIRRPAIIYQLVDLAREEMLRIDGEGGPPGFWENTSYSIWGMFVEHDHWVAPQTRTALYEKYAGLDHVDFETVPGIVHAFVLRESIKAADAAAAAIKRAKTLNAASALRKRAI